MNTNRDEPKSKVQLLIGLLFFLLGGIGCIGGIGAYVRDTAIVREGLRATARIIDKDVMRDSSEGNEYEISYTFDIPATNSSSPSQSIEGQAHIDKSRWKPCGLATQLRWCTPSNHRTETFPSVEG